MLLLWIFLISVFASASWAQPAFERQLSHYQWCARQEAEQQRFSRDFNFKRAHIGFLIEEAYQLRRRDLLRQGASIEELRQMKEVYTNIYLNITNLLNINVSLSELSAKISQLKIFTPDGPNFADADLQEAETEVLRRKIMRHLVDSKTLFLPCEASSSES